MKIDTRIEGAPMTDVAAGTDLGVWVTDIPRDASSGYGFTCAQAEEDEDAFIRLIYDSKQGEMIASDRYPSEMWVDPQFNERKKLKHIFRANGLFAVSGACAEVLRRHDMGRNRLHPVRLYKKDRTTPYGEGEYFFLNICEKKEGFDPKQSANFNDRRGDETPRLGGMPLVLDHGDIAVSASVLDGPDLWMDRTLFNSNFVKGALARELLDRKMFHPNGTEGLSIARARVIGGQA